MKRFLLLLWFLFMAAITMFGQVLKADTAPLSTGYRIRDTVRVKLLVSHTETNRGIAFTIDGYEVKGYSGKRQDGIFPEKKLIIYLDDRKRPLKNLEVWIVTPHSH